MDSFAFGALCREASRVLDVDDLDELAREGQITLDGVEVGLVFDEEDTRRLFCYVDIGSAAELPSTPDEVSTYRDMLTLNLLRGSKAAGVVAFDPGSKHLLLSAHLSDPDSLDGTRLATKLKACGKQQACPRVVDPAQSRRRQPRCSSFAQLGMKACHAGQIFQFSPSHDNHHAQHL